MAAAALPAFPHAENLGAAVVAPGLHLRPASDRDLAFLRELYAGTRAEELAAVPWLPAMRAAFLDDQFTLQHRHWLSCHPQAEYLIVECHDQGHGTPIGRCYVDFNRTGTNGGDALLIDISLLPAVCGHGVGSAVLAHLLRRCDQRGQAMLLHVLHTNPNALRLYQRLGFAATDDDGVRLRLRRPAAPVAELID